MSLLERMLVLYRAARLEQIQLRQELEAAYAELDVLNARLRVLERAMHRVRRAGLPHCLPRIGTCACGQPARCYNAVGQPVCFRHVHGAR